MTKKIDWPICPCGQRARRTKTRYGYRYAHCDLWSWDAAPLVDKATHEARKAAHEAFDVLWKAGTLDRGAAYSRLREILEITEDECHMKLMDAETSSMVPAAVKQIMEDLER